MSSYARTHTTVTLASGAHGHPHFSGAPGAQSGQTMPSMHGARRRFVADLSQCLLEFVLQLMPTPDELAVKEDVRKLLERLIRTIEPDSRLLSFGSTANGFSLRNSDMDLCCLIDSEERLPASDLVTMIGDLLERETKFHVKPLPHARIPIVKLSLDPSPGLPLGIACDIGFENRLALENTRLLYCYSMVDPARVRSLVLFLKVWSKRRKINSPYQGTLSSYGYVLLVIYFLVHVKNPPVLPNLQQIPPLRPIPPEEYYFGDRNIWFFDDIDLLRQRWQSSNTESVAELLIDFFRYYARDFSYNTGVASIRAGLLKKDTKGWQNDNDPRFDARERNRLCIEDPFELDYNVARCVTKDGLYLIRGEFMRASRILQQRPERAYVALADLCQERDETNTKLNAAHNTIFTAPRLSIPPQTPYTVGSKPFRPKGVSERDRLSPPRKSADQEAALNPASPQVPARPETLPEHMAPKRGKYTSPPPPEAPDADRTSFESRLGLGLSLATAPTDAREQEKAYLSSSSNSEILSDDGDERSDIAADDDVKSVRSATEPSIHLGSRVTEQSHVPYSPSISVPNRLSGLFSGGIGYSGSQPVSDRASEGATNAFSAGYIPGPRGRQNLRGINEAGPSRPPVSYPVLLGNQFTFSRKTEALRRSNSGPARANHVAGGPRLRLASAQMQMPFNVPLPPSPVVTNPHPSSSPTIFYETSAHRSASSSYCASPRSPIPSPNSAGLQSPHLYGFASQSSQGRIYDQGSDDSQSSSHVVEPPGRLNKSTRGLLSSSQAGSASPSTLHRSMHAHSHSSSTIMGPPTPAASMTAFALAPLQTHDVSPPLGSPAAMSPSPSTLAHFSGFPRPSMPYDTPVSPFSVYSSPGGSFRNPQPSSPRLSSPFPHITRRQPQQQMHSRMGSSAPPPIPPVATLGSPVSPDVASPVASPVSSASGSSPGGSVSVGSIRSDSPISSTSPRTADFVSPQQVAASPERQQPKVDRGTEDSPQASKCGSFNQHAQFRFSFQPQSPLEPRTTAHASMIGANAEAKIRCRQEDLTPISESPLSPFSHSPSSMVLQPRQELETSPVVSPLTGESKQFSSADCQSGFST